MPSVASRVMRCTGEAMTENIVMASVATTAPSPTEPSVEPSEITGLVKIDSGWFQWLRPATGENGEDHNLDGEEDADEQDQQQRGGIKSIGLNDRALTHHLAQLIGAGDLAKQDKAAQHGQATAAGDGQRHARTVARVGPVLPIADQQER